MSLPTTPEGWAIHLSKLLEKVHEFHNSDRFPVNVASIAKEYSRGVFPKSRISIVEGKNFSPNFDGMLLPNPDDSGEWGILYNDAKSHSKGRINFTLGHEFGHYLLHREKYPEGIRCTSRDMLNWKSDFRQTEVQANKFASFLLMPLDDFREQTKNAEITIELMRYVVARYEVSLVAAILKWLDNTPRRAMIVVGKDGFVDWSRSSDALYEFGIYYRARQEVVELPMNSLAARPDLSQGHEVAVTHPPGIWPGEEEVQEMTVFSRRYGVTTTILLYPRTMPTSQYSREAFEHAEEQRLIEDWTPKFKK